MSQLSESASTITSAAEQVVMLRQQRASSVGGPDLLLTFDEDGYPHGQRVSVGSYRCQMGRDACLVVGGTASVQPPVALRRLERLGVPRAVIALRLYVVVGVQQDGRRACQVPDAVR